MGKTPTKLVKGQQALTRYFAASPGRAKKATMKNTGVASSSPTSRRSLPYADDEEVENEDQNTQKQQTNNNTQKTRSKPRASASPAKKRAKMEKPAVDDDDDEEEEEERKDDAEANEPKYEIGTKVEKEFPGHGWFSGEVMSYEEGLYQVEYEDGDVEDMTVNELEEILAGKRDDKTKKQKEDVVVDDEEEDKENVTTTGRGRRRSASKKVNYCLDEDNDDFADTDDEEEEDRKPAAKKKRATTSSKIGTSKTTKKKKTIHDDSDDDFDMVDIPEEDDDLDSDVEMADDDDEIESEEEEVKPKARGGRKKAAPKKKKAKDVVDEDDDDMEEDDDGTAKNASDKEFRLKLKKELGTVKPHNNPQAWPSKGAYVDPVGVDPTHGIVERIVADQVRKVGKLLQLVQKQQLDSDSDAGEEEPLLGELQFPIRLQTACSGTDAPSIALGLIKESLNKMLPAQSKGLFEYSHEMSCEIEPFKQAYIGRNFPTVPLFPDITKLTASPEVLDVYGRPQTIPDGNLFVAGTSCKDFSMLKTRDRQDIEDKGTSGETFLAAVEFLEQKQPPVAIFENVDGAPWDKMQEYIRGRLELSKRNDTKAIKAGNKADADKQLKFSVNKKGQYVAEEVPRQVGIRAGAIVEGFVKGGSNANAVKPLISEDKKVKRYVTLGEMAKAHKINLNSDTLVMKKKARYCTRLIKLDTKEYGLPQTRNRKYLFIWRSDDPEDDLGDYFEDIMEHLKTPLLHSMDAFLLPDTHDRIRCFREALRSGPGLMVKKERAREKDFWNWDESRVKDVTLHIAYRRNAGIAERLRWITGWAPRGRKSLAPLQWPELYDCWNHRRLDLIDCFSSAAIRDAISRDPLHHSFTWDLSQNVTRAPYRTAHVGVSGCVTPGGELLLPHKGRSMMGYEKLLLQGIPFSRLLLGPESEVQLSDLAGNAMSVSVVCATMLSAICAPHLRRQMEKDKKASLKSFGLNPKSDTTGAVLAKRGDLFETERDTNSKNFTKVFVDIANELAHDAFRSSVLCTCESSGTCTKNPKILECSGCGWLVCHDCSGRYNTSSHSLREVETKEGDDGRPDPIAFERRLRCAVPSILRLGEGWERKESGIANVDGLESYSFQLQQVDRKKGYWHLTYGAWEDHGSARQVAEIRVAIGKTETLSSNVGFDAHLRCFAPAIRQNEPHRGTLKDSARLIYKLNASDDTAPVWEAPSASRKGCLNLVGSGECDSQRVQAGLNDVAAKALAAHTPMKKFLPPVESRNPMTMYHRKWKKWPKEIVVSKGILKSPDGRVKVTYHDDRVNGTYKYIGCQHTVVLSALWRREGTNDQPPMYIYIRPDVIRTKLDVAVIARTPTYSDSQEICVLHDWIPENALDDETHATKATFPAWEPCEGLEVEVPQPALSLSNTCESFHEEACKSSGKEPPVLCEMSGLSDEVILSLLEHNETNNDDMTAIVLDLIGRSGTRNAKRMSIIAAPSLLKYAAQDKLPLKLSEWYRLPSSSQYGKCVINVPPRPVEQWREVGEKGEKIERFYDAEESNEYYKGLFNRPPAFQVNVVKSEGKLVVRMNPSVAAHRAAAQLGGEATGAIEVDYCLSELFSMGEPDTKEFRVPNSDAYEEKKIDDLALPLYTRQAKALSRMMAIENGDVLFSEEERSEHVLPGVGWCMIARASKKSPLRGGVLGDAIGSGKTVVTIALILAGAAKARANRNIETGRSSATLIVVPPGLVTQWDDERKKFTGTKLKCIIIHSTDTLKTKSVKEICSADIVIVPASLIEEVPGKGDKKRRPYTEQLSKKAGAGKIPPAPTSYSQREAPTIEGTWVRNMASGPGIYVGNDGNQRKRDAQAYYGHCYSQAIAKLREKSFDASERGVPIEYFTWERVVIDECHESLVTGRQQETSAADFKEKARRGAREFLGVAQTDIKKRPLLAASGVWGLTGTPLLETEARVTELANLMGGTYLTGAAHHWRKEERESGRDLFLNQSEGTRSREYRCAVQDACHAYVEMGCQRNRGERLNVELQRKTCPVNMSRADADAFLKETSSVQIESFSITPEQLGDKAADVLGVTAKSSARHHALLDVIDNIRRDDSSTKIIVFANTSFGGYDSALEALKTSDKKFCHVSDGRHTVQEQNEIISWFRHVDATEEDKARPRVLLLSFEQAAGHNLQEACHDVIIYDPMYSGSDPVADASVEEQAVGRVFRQGQQNDVTVTRIVVKGPNGEDCLDDYIIARNLDEDVLRAATSNFD